MKFMIIAPSLALALLGGVASAQGVVEQCYTKTYVGPQYRVTQHKIRDEYTQYVDHGSYVERVRQPAWYEERRTKTRDDRYVLTPVACR